MSELPGRCIKGSTLSHKKEKVSPFTVTHKKRRVGKMGTYNESTRSRADASRNRHYPTHKTMVSYTQTVAGKYLGHLLVFPSPPFSPPSTLPRDLIPYSMCIRVSLSFLNSLSLSLFLTFLFSLSLSLSQVNHLVISLSPHPSPLTFRCK